MLLQIRPVGLHASRCASSRRATVPVAASASVRVHAQAVRPLSVSMSAMRIAPAAPRSFSGRRAAASRATRLRCEALFGFLKSDPAEKTRKTYQARVEQINKLESKMQGLSDQQLREKTVEFKQRVAKGESLDSLLPEAFAVRQGCSVGHREGTAGPAWAGVLPHASSCATSATRCMHACMHGRRWCVRDPGAFWA
jgi:hypothetical protein